jgi:hypothetical protein
VPKDPSEKFYTVSQTDCLTAWLTKHRPPPLVWDAVRAWIDGLFDDPWQAPAQSVEIEHPHNQDPVLHAEVPGTWFEVTYAVDEATMNVRFLKCGQVPEDQQTYD